MKRGGTGLDIATSPRAVKSSVPQPATPTDHELTVVIPAFNEELRLPNTLTGVAEYLNAWGVDYRVLVVDDGSADQTASLAGQYGRRFRTIKLPQQSGKGAAVRTGMLAATGNVVAFTDADLPYDLDSLRTGYDAIVAKQCAVVFGARDLAESACIAQRRWLRTIATGVFREIVRQLVSREITDTQCGLKVFSRAAANDIFSRTTLDGFAFDAEVVYLTRRLALPFLRIPVTLVNEYSSTISLTRHALPMLLDVLRLRLRDFRGEYRLDNLPGAATQNAADREAPSKAAA